MIRPFSSNSSARDVIGEKLAEPKTPDEAKNEAMTEAATKIQLWKAIYEKYTKKGLSVPEADFWNDLREMCGLTIEEAKNASVTVLNAYKEDIKLLRTGQSLTPAMNPNIGMGPMTTPPPAPVTPEGMMVIAVDGMKAILPKEETTKAWGRLKRMVDAFLEEDDAPKKAK